MFTRVSKKTIPPRSAVMFVILLGVVSLFSDMVYEGSRSVIGSVFSVMGASGAIVGFVAGFGELAGNVLRIFSGYFVDRSGKYWLVTFIGYGCLFAIPLISIAPTWQIVASLLIIERIGKAIRTPARDAMLSYATQKMGRGFGFGLHQLFDQLGGVLGPLIMTVVLLTHQPYSLGFLILLVPTLLTLMMLTLGNQFYSHPQNLEIEQQELVSHKIPAVFWIYLTAACLMGAGYADFPLIAFHLQKINIISPVWIPAFYMMAMGMSAISALFFGWLYDRIGITSLIIAILLSALFAPCVFYNGFNFALLGMVLWGVGMGAQRSLLKAVVGNMISKNKRGSAFGIFNAGYGVAWFLGSWLMGVLYDTSIHAVIIFSLSAELLAIPFIVWVMRYRR